MIASSEKKSFFDFFPTPEYLLLSTSGLVITDESIKFVRLERGLFGHSLSLSRYEKIPLLEGIVQSGFINDAEKLTAILKDLSFRHKFEYIHATLPEERAYLFSATIDKVPAQGLRDAVAFIIEENVPVSLANSVFDFDIVEEFPASNQIKVTASVLSRKVVDFYIQVFEAAGITPVSFDIESQAIAHAIIPKGDKSTQLVINLSALKTGFYVVEDGVVQFTTTLPYGASGESPYPHLSDLKGEMRKIFAFWSARNTGPDAPERKIEKALLTGAGALKNDFVTELMSECPVEYGTALAWTNAELDVATLPKEIYQDSLDYAAAIGVALPRLG